MFLSALHNFGWRKITTAVIRKPGDWVKSGSGYLLVVWPETLRKASEYR